MRWSLQVTWKKGNCAGCCASCLGGGVELP